VTGPLPRLVFAVTLLLAPACSERGGAGPSGSGGGEIITATPDLIDSLRGSSASRVVLVNVWATWCAPCLEEMPGLVRLHGEFTDDELEVIMVSTDDTDDIDSLVAPALAKAGVAFPTYILAPGMEDAFIRSLHPDWSGALPATFVTARGTGRSEWFVGGRSHDDFRRAVSELLDK